MVRYYIAGGIVAVSIIIYALIQCILSDSRRVRSISKPAWILAIVLLPLVGALLWFWLGRPISGPRPAVASASGYDAPGRPTAPDDDDAFLRNLERQRELKKREEELKRREEELKKREGESGTDPDSPSAGDTTK
ncbi:hypothetical protein HD598_002042 [Neomicrococcus aestuarii]|uniref:Cardiolipin synthase N-terminal domain-containing protein n=1 Tax=Neomicrococcus aestuarii TaxID=556325 RepID=A0A7W8TWD6_9MICC|nr:PLD nuclease N-terminal domain-containing protein [Neomicrococcus aestuarii]MBB5513355.1 hypothetical protein [Neomicrococcus aestuarii]